MATALVDLHAGQQVLVVVCGRETRIQILTDVPSGHKFAIAEIPKGSAVLKYGEPIGQSGMRIERGEHVHTHNVISPKKRKE